MRSTLEERRSVVQKVPADWDRLGNTADCTPFNWVVVRQSGPGMILVTRANSSRNIESWAFFDLWLRHQ